MLSLYGRHGAGLSCPFCGQAGSLIASPPPALFPIPLTHRLRWTSRRFPAPSEGPQPPAALKLSARPPFSYTVLTLCGCLSRTDSKHLGGSTGSAAVGEGGADPGGVGGVPRAPAAPLAADGARPSARTERARGLQFSPLGGRAG